MKIPKFPQPAPGPDGPGAAPPGPLGQQTGVWSSAKDLGSRLAGFPYRYLKRAVDVSLSLFALFFVLSWLMPLLCLLVLADTGVPVFFVQKRIGRWGRPFHCIKLRTMGRANAGEGRLPTRLGYWLRCHKLDELPQFINVLKGDMSIVGPRPHMISDHRAFSRELGRDYCLRHAVLPGITGLAQVRGYEGQVSSRHKLRGRLRLDLFYIRHWSMGLEFRIMYRTIRLFMQGMAKGPGHLW
ncbi:MAG: sugar transferase [Phaeodactylibacter sp.]|nr:sugar transferase [Phaeodactylibacter sp.]